QAHRVDRSRRRLGPCCGDRHAQRQRLAPSWYRRWRRRHRVGVFLPWPSIPVRDHTAAQALHREGVVMPAVRMKALPAARAPERSEVECGYADRTQQEERERWANRAERPRQREEREDGEDQGQPACCERTPRGTQPPPMFLPLFLPSLLLDERKIG